MNIEALDSIVAELVPQAKPATQTNLVQPVRRIVDLPNPCTLPPSKQAFLVEGAIPAGAITLLTGRGGIGKTWVALDLARSFLKSESWLGRRTAPLGQVLILDGENPLGIVQDRLERFGLNDAPGLKYWGSWLDWHVPAFSDPIYADFAQSGGLIIVDSFAAFYDGESENDSVQIRRWFGWLRRLASKGASVIVIHHTGKGDSGKSYRGSSDILAAIDAAFCVEAEESSAGSMQALKLTWFKMRGAEEPKPIHFRLADDRLEVTADPSADEEKARAEAILNALGKKGRASARNMDEMFKALSIPRDKGREAVKHLEASGRIVADAGERGASAYRVAGRLHVVI